MAMCQVGEFFNIQYGECWIGNGFCHNAFCVWTECFRQILKGVIRIDKRAVDAQFFHGNTKKIEGSAIDSTGAN